MFNPFPGLRPFEADEEHLFFGRERETDELLRRLRTTRFLAVVGTSGSGKSSLVRSGLIPSLQGGYLVGASSSWRIAVFRPGEDPIGHLAKSLAKPDVVGFADEEIAATGGVLMEATLRRGPLGLVDVVRQSHIPSDENLLVLVDQFEELFRFGHNSQIANSRDEAIAFVRLLLEAARQREAPVYVALTMRSDFIGDCMEFPGLSDAVNDGLYLVGRMSRDALRSAITGPVAVAGGALAARLVHRVLNDLGDDHDQLPRVQHALMRTWEHWERTRTDGAPAEAPIDIANYEAIGTFDFALSRHAEEAYEEASALGIGHLTEHVFKALTDTFGDERGVRRPASVAELSAATGASEADVMRVVEVFRRPGRSFLMPPAAVTLSPRTIVDLSHESLMRCWERLQTWSEEERAAAEFYVRLSQAAVWHGQGKAGLWRNPELDLARRWREHNHPTAAWARRYDERFDQAITFLELSEQARAREEAEVERGRKAALRRAQWAAGILATFTVIAVSLAYWAWRENVRAEQNLDFARAAVDESLASADRDPAAIGADVPQVQAFRRELLAKADRFYRAFMDQKSGSEKLRRDSAFAHFRLGHINRLLEQRDDALREYAEAIAQFGALASDRPDNVEYRQTLANAHNWVGELHRPFPDQYDQARPAYDKALELQQALVTAYPTRAALVRDLARTTYNRGILQSGRPDGAAGAEADFRKSIALLEPLAGSNAEAAQELARAYNNLGSLIALGDGRAAEVRQWWEKAIAIDERLAAADPGNREYRLELAIYCNNLAALLDEAGDDDAASARSRQATALLDDLARPAPSLLVARADAHGLSATILRVRDAVNAEREFSAALTMFVDGTREPALARQPDFHLRFGDLLLNLAAFAGSPAGGESGRALFARGVRAYAALAEQIASSGSESDARVALETIARVLPVTPERDRGPLTIANETLQRKVRTP